MAQNFTEGDLNYSVNEDGTTVTLTGHFYGTNAVGTFDIPSEVNYNNQTYTVTAIGNNAFSGCSGLTGSLVVPNSVTTIGDHAFSGCFAMQGSLTIGTAVTEIGNYAFQGCGFNTVNFNASECVRMYTYDEYYGINSVFSGCNNLITLNIGENVQMIPSCAFRECGFTGSLIIPNMVTTIGSEAFYNCSGFTGDLIIGNSVTMIEEYAFNNCSGFTGSLILGNSLTTIGSRAFCGCSGFTGNLVIPNSVTTIGGGSDSFFGSDGAFGDCSGFTGDLIIPNSVTMIQGYAFKGCTGFTSLTIGTSVTEIEPYAFSGCTNFTEVNFNATNCTSMGNYSQSLAYVRSAFGSGPTQATLNIGENVEIIPSYAFSGCSGFVGDLIIPNSVTAVGSRAFQDCSGLTSVTIGDSVTRIWSRAFQNCSGLTSLTIGRSVSIIDERSFLYCSGIASIQTLAETPPAIYSFAFSQVDHSIPVIVPCGSLSAYQNSSSWSEFTNIIEEYCDPLTYSINDDGVSVTVTGHVDGTAATGPLVIPETKTIDGVTYTVTGIGNSAFSGCSGLTGDLVIPNTVTAIGNSAFQSCGGFTGSLTIGNSVTTIGNNAFRNCMGFTGSLVIPDSVTSIGGYTFMNCTGFTGNLIIGNSVTTIGTLAFACQYGGNYSGSLVIPNSVTTIGTGTFMNCSGLTGNLDIPSSITSMNSSFNGCSGFTSITLHWDIPISGCSIGSVNYEIPLIVPCGSASLYRYNPNWRYFSDIQEDCSGMYAVSATVNPTEGGSVVFRRVGETLLSDSFEEYTVGNTIATEAVAAGHDWWNTWDSNPGGEKDGLVAEYDGSQCGHFTYGNDQILLLGNKESGIYDLEFDILVPDGKNAFFSILHQFDNGSANEAVKFHLHVSNSYDPTITPGQGVVTVGYSNIVSYIPCVYDAWMHFRVHIDIDADLARFYYTNSGEEELFLCQWQWSLGGQPGYGTLAAMDFWPPKDAETSEYFVDNISLKQLGDGTSKGYDANIQIVSEEASNERGAVRTGRHFAPDSECTLTATANEGYTFVNWTENGTVVSTNATYSFTVTSNRNLVANFEQALSDLYVITATANPSEGGTVTINGTSSGETFISDNFEEYTVGNKIAYENIVTGHDWWTTWNNLPGSSEDGVVASYNGNKCGHLTYGNDQILLLGDNGDGVYELAFDVLVPQGKNGYFNVMHHFAGSNSTWAFQCYLHMTNNGSSSTQAPGHGTVHAGGNGVADIPCVYDAWMHFRLHVDTYADTARYYYTAPGENEVLIYEWQWSLDTYGNNVVGSGLEAMNFYPPQNAANSEYYLDNISFTRSRGEAEPEAHRGAVRASGTFVSGTTCVLTATPNEGYTFNNWTKDGVEVSTNAIYSFTVTEDAAFVANFSESQSSITQTSDLAQGWNWWSTYIEQDGIDGLTMLEESLGANGHQIKSQTDFVTNYGSMWFGMLGSIDNEETYMIDNTSSCQVVMTGAPVTPSDHPITVSSGWNWIGYPCTNTMSVSEAFSGYTPANGDQVKSQSDYAMYFNGMWIGQLINIAPGTGLMYLSNNATSTTLVYPDGGRSAEIPAMPKATHWTNDIHAYPHNMTVMAVVELDDVELTTDNYELSAFYANGECRGSAKLVYVEPLNRHVAFLTIAGDDAVELSFRLFDAENGIEYADAEETLSYTVNAIVGDVDDLYVVHFRGTTGMDEFANSIQIFPNPVQAGDRISINTADEAKSPVRVEIVNVLGVETLRATSEQTPAMVTAPSGAGVYTMRITVEGKGTVVRKLVVR